MGRRGLTLLAIAVIAGCGGASQKKGPGTGTSAKSSVEKATSAHSPSALAGLANRTLVAGELPGFRTSAAVVVSNLRAWVAFDEVNPERHATVLARLRRLGFVAAARDDLVAVSAGSARGLSVVEKFRSSSSARAELAAELRDLGRGEAFAIPGVPGAHGFRASGSNSPGYNVAFAAGPYFYLIRVRWRRDFSRAPSAAILVAAVRSLYGRVNES
jgi:hypothetical protein